MKRIISLILIAAFAAITILPAQSHGERVRDPQPRERRSSGHSSHSDSHHHSNVDDVLRTVETIESTLETIEMLYLFGRLADYRGIRLGYNVASLRLAGDIREDLDPKDRNGFNAGFVLGYQCGKSPFYIEPGLYYSGKGGSIGDYKYSMHMIEIPVVVKYNIPMAEKVAFQPFFGMFYSSGIGGDTKEIHSGDSYRTFNDEGFKYWDFGLRGGIGLGIDHLYLEAAYDLGLTCLPSYNYADNGFNSRFDHIRSGCMSLSIGFNF